MVARPKVARRASSVRNQSPFNSTQLNIEASEAAAKSIDLSLRSDRASLSAVREQRRRLRADVEEAFQEVQQGWRPAGIRHWLLMDPGSRFCR